MIKRGQIVVRRAASSPESSTSDRLDNEINSHPLVVNRIEYPVPSSDKIPNSSHTNDSFNS